MTDNERTKSDARNAAHSEVDTPEGASIEPHAQLRDGQGKLLAGIVRRDGEWVLGMDGKIAGSSSEAAQVFALIKRAAVLHQAQGTPVRLTWSDAIKDAVERESAESGVSFEEYERQLLRAMDGEAAADDPSEVSGSSVE